MADLINKLTGGQYSMEDLNIGGTSGTYNVYVKFDDGPFLMLQEGLSDSQSFKVELHPDKNHYYNVTCQQTGKRVLFCAVKHNNKKQI